MVKGLVVIIALALLSSGAPVAAKSAAAAPDPDALRVSHQQFLRVAHLMLRLQTLNAGSCPKRSFQYGFVVARVDDAASPALRDAFANALRLGDVPTALTVVPEGAAASAGLHEGDRIAAINGVPWPPSGPTASGARDTFWAAYRNAHTASEMQIDAQVGGEVHSLRLLGQTGCTAIVVLSNQKPVNASTFGSQIEVNSGLEALLQDDDELAFVLGHELAHVILEHSGPGKEAQMKDPVQRHQAEMEADRLGLFLMARAGFNPAAAVTAVQRMYRTNGPITRLLGLHGPYMPMEQRCQFLKEEADLVRTQVQTQKAAH